MNHQTVVRSIFPSSKKKNKKNPSTTDHRPITTDFGYFVIDLLFFLISFADEDVKNGGEGKSRAPSIALFVGRREREKEGVADLKKRPKKKKETKRKREKLACLIKARGPPRADLVSDGAHHSRQITDADDGIRNSF